MNSIFYYPYASFTNTQMPILKATTVYFDKLHILDPFKAGWKTIGVGEAANEVAFLTKKEILSPVHPAEVLKKFEDQITKFIQQDMTDPEFLELCKNYSKGEWWTISLAKIPKEIREDPEFKPLDKSMQNLMGDFSREVTTEAGKYAEEYLDYLEGIRSYDEYRENFDESIEYRYADYPLALGESIMINHALFAGLLHSKSTPITDDPFHKKIFEYKIKKAAQTPLIQDILEDRFKSSKLKSDFFANYLLTDKVIEFPTLTNMMHLEDVYRFREDHKDELERARRKIMQLSRKIKEIPLSADFEKEVDAALGDVDAGIEELEIARNSWLKSDRGSKALKISGLVAGAAAATLSIVFSATPLAPVSLIIAGLGLFGDQVIPGLEITGDIKKNKREALENGLHYFLSLK